MPLVQFCRKFSQPFTHYSTGEFIGIFFSQCLDAVGFVTEEHPATENLAPPIPKETYWENPRIHPNLDYFPKRAG